MKIDIYTLLGMIKDGKAPKRIIYEGRVFEYDEDSVVMRDYYNKEFGHLFDDIDCITEVLNDEVEILETTINWEEKVKKMPDVDIAEDEIPDKIEKLGFENCTTPASANENEAFLMTCINFTSLKIDEIIDKINKED